MSIKDLTDEELRSRAEKQEQKQKDYHRRHNMKIRLQAKWAEENGYKPSDKEIDAELAK